MGAVLGHLGVGKGHWGQDLPEILCSVRVGRVWLCCSGGSGHLGTPALPSVDNKRPEIPSNGRAGHLGAFLEISRGQTDQW